jgi:hypothetical protein
VASRGFLSEPAKEYNDFLQELMKRNIVYTIPKVFSILADWLQLMEQMILEHENKIVVKAGFIHPRLKKHF